MPDHGRRRERKARACIESLRPRVLQILLAMSPFSGPLARCSYALLAPTPASQVRWVKITNLTHLRVAMALQSLAKHLSLNGVKRIKIPFPSFHTRGGKTPRNKHRQTIKTLELKKKKIYGHRLSASLRVYGRRRGDT